MEGAENSPQEGAHVLLVPYPTQGHVNPMIQFGKRLAFHGLRPTLATTRYILSKSKPEPSSVRITAISDGFDSSGMEKCDAAEYLSRLELVGSETLEQLIRSEKEQGRPVRVLVYDAFLPWALPVARQLGVAAAAFFTQPCAVDVIYEHVWARKIKVPITTKAPIQLTGLGFQLDQEDMPSFVVAPGTYPAFLDMVLNQFKGLQQADDVFVNSFYDIQPQEAEYMASTWGAKTIGPTVPSFYLDDGRLPSDTTYGFNLFDITQPYMAWLGTQPPRSVVFVSYGSISDLDRTQIEEVANGLYNSDKPFLWVVRSSEVHKLPEDFNDKCKDKGLIVSWCTQLQVLAHKATGCFLTHCGWNSIMEAIALGVPLVAMPQWTDQPTTAKYVECAWGIGARVRPDGEGLVRRKEVERCIKEVMDGERKEEYSRNAAEWMEKAKEAMQEGGTSDNNIVEFVAKYASS